MNKEKKLYKQLKNLDFITGAISREVFIILMRLGVKEISELPTGLKKHCLSEKKREYKILTRKINICTELKNAWNGWKNEQSMSN
jgi:hypothetical protein|tara:strand:- start:25 stop:279 length:255 start_codon:yes stop_codon:yes gene_type:complete